MSDNQLEGDYSLGMDWLALREALRVRRTVSGKTLDQLAADTKINRATIHAIENVKLNPKLKPRVETVEIIARALGLKMSDLFLLAEGDTLGVKDAIPLDNESSPLSVEDAERVSRFTRALHHAARSALATARAHNALREARERKPDRSRRGA